MRFGTDKLKLGDDHQGTLLLSIVVWLCSLPLLLLLAVPFLGWTTTATIAATWLLVLLLVCFGICLRRLPRRTRHG